MGTLLSCWEDHNHSQLPFMLRRGCYYSSSWLRELSLLVDRELTCTVEMILVSTVLIQPVQTTSYIGIFVEFDCGFKFGHKHHNDDTMADSSKGKDQNDGVKYNILCLHFTQLFSFLTGPREIVIHYQPRSYFHYTEPSINPVTPK